MLKSRREKERKSYWILYKSNSNLPDARVLRAGYRPKYKIKPKLDNLYEFNNNVSCMDDSYVHREQHLIKK